MYDFFTTALDKAILPIEVIHNETFDLCTLSNFEKNWLRSAHDDCNNLYLLPDESGQLAKVILKQKGENLADLMSQCVKQLPCSHVYRFDGLSEQDYKQCALHWALNAYQFDVYKKSIKHTPVLYLPDNRDQKYLFAEIEAIFLVRNLVNTPAETLNTTAFSAQAYQIAKQCGAKYKEICGQKLLKANYPAIHAVGRASIAEPRLVTLTWGSATDPHLALVGKGVCFDTGGLNIKPGNGMTLMKKDMGGAAHALALAQWIMQLELPIYLKVYLPLAENSIAGNAIRPGDVIQTRKGLSVEIGNTDAEGRLILADAMADACEAKPDLLIDFATLTGAARVALGPEIPVFFSKNQNRAIQLQRMSQKIKDTVWQLPLHHAYKKTIESKIADLNNSGTMPYAGAITAALFLNEFVETDIDWLHFDMMAWNTSTRPSHPEGGEAQGLRAVFYYLLEEMCERVDGV